MVVVVKIELEVVVVVEVGGVVVKAGVMDACCRGPSLADFRIFRIPPQMLRISGFFTLGGNPPT